MTSEQIPNRSLPKKYDRTGGEGCYSTSEVKRHRIGKPNCCEEAKQVIASRTEIKSTC